MKKQTKEEELIEEYRRGFEDGKQNSLKHNINLMKLQLKASRKLK